MFSNGQEARSFSALFCERCRKYVPMSMNGEGCRIEEAISQCSITGEKEDFPYDDLIPCGRMCRYICKEFDGETEELCKLYEKAIEDAIKEAQAQ